MAFRYLIDLILHFSVVEPVVLTVFGPILLGELNDI
jgi:hypothetical protein